MIRGLAYKNGKIYKDFPVEKIKEFLSDSALIWLDMEKPDEKELSLLNDVFHFHPLAIEDCVKRQQRAKVDDYKDYYFILLNAFKGRDVNRHFTYSEIYMFLGKNYFVTLHWENLNTLESVYRRTAESEIIFERGIDFIPYNVLDAVVDDYFPVMDRIGERIDYIEEEIFKNPYPQKIQDEILLLKRNMLKLRKTLSPQREVLNILLRHELYIIKEENRPYFMDVYDHLLRIIDLLDTYQDLLASTLELFMSQISNKMNGIMKTLTIITTIIMPLTLITGIYGMNFKYMPELNNHYGYFITLAVMGLITILEFIFFKIKKWL
ncbi:magnesium/cobalt transporter CorA [Caldanaerobius polysaccharolyticus]|uniref:magnesium/cobalt transporter CorA n=1 Tax=Caldanaerobius polysaccharolyticus TaxID=44256 RepID=UPI00047922C7|nr:magnesium/cobalt transporter CorA [Caldanaerobius polysaccharolyticus]